MRCHTGLCNLKFWEWQYNEGMGRRVALFSREILMDSSQSRGQLSGYPDSTPLNPHCMFECLNGRDPGSTIRTGTCPAPGRINKITTKWATPPRHPSRGYHNLSHDLFMASLDVISQKILQRCVRDQIRQSNINRPIYHDWAKRRHKPVIYVVWFRIVPDREQMTTGTRKQQSYKIVAEMSPDKVIHLLWFGPITRTVYRPLRRQTLSQFELEINIVT